MKTTHKVSLGAVIGLVALAGCTDPGSFDPNDPNKNRREGAITGAVLGGLAGAITGDGDRKGEIITGAVIGGVAGGAIGARLDQQAAELDRDLGNGIGVFRQGNDLIVRMPQDILFAVDSATVNPGLRSDLFVLADSLNRYPGTSVIIVGHTDNTGGASYNQNLSERRAQAVANVLVSGGVSSGRLVSLGAGENQPIASNLTPEGRQQNRRVDITIRPN